MTSSILDCRPAQEKLRTIATTPLPIPVRTVLPLSGEVTSLDADYILLDEIASGGGGTVWRALQPALKREVALKRLRMPDGDATPATAMEFLREAVVTGGLEHPGIVPIYEVASDQYGMPFYTMALVSGVSWSEAWSQRSEEHNLDIFDRVCDVVAYAHAKGVIHCDLKPENVMLGAFGSILVVDWGNALLLDRLAEYPTGMVYGTPAFLAPEQTAGNAALLSVRTDVYLLGAILHLMVTGSPPHDLETPVRAIQAARTNLISHASAPGELAAIARKALATDPADRHADVPELQHEVQVYRQRVISRVLTSAGMTALAAGRLSQADDDFLLAISHLQEACQRWAGNAEARTGLEEARFAYAEQAEMRGDLALALRLVALSDHPAAVALAKRLDDALLQQRTRERRMVVAKRLAAAAVAIGMIGLIAGLSLSYAAHSTYQDAARERMDAETHVAEEEVLESAASGHWHPQFVETFSSSNPGRGISILDGNWRTVDGRFRQDGPGTGRLAIHVPLRDARIQVDVVGPGEVEFLWPINAEAPERKPLSVFLSDDAITLAVPGSNAASTVRRPAVAEVAAHLLIERVGGDCRVYLNGTRRLDAVVPQGGNGEATATVAVTILARPGTLIGNLRVDALERHAIAMARRPPSRSAH